MSTSKPQTRTRFRLLGYVMIAFVALSGVIGLSHAPKPDPSYQRPIVIKAPSDAQKKLIGSRSDAEAIDRPKTVRPASER